MSDNHKEPSRRWQPLLDVLDKLLSLASKVAALIKTLFF